MSAFQIKRGNVVIEEHTSYRAAERAFWVLTAHELKHGRVADLTVDLHSSHGVCFPAECVPPLPEWAMEILKAHDF